MDTVDKDVLQRFLLERAGVRGVFVRLGASWREVAGRAAYPPALHALLGEALAASALLTGNIKLDGALSIELKSSGALRLLFAECNDQGRLRGLARWTDPLPEPLALQALPAGSMAITIGNVESGQRYQGLVDLQQPSLGAALENYFARSEQLPARILLAADDTQAVGLMLQQLPGGNRAMFVAFRDYVLVVEAPTLGHVDERCGRLSLAACACRWWPRCGARRRRLAAGAAVDGNARRP